MCAHRASFSVDSCCFFDVMCLSFFFSARKTESAKKAHTMRGKNNGCVVDRRRLTTSRSRRVFFHTKRISYNLPYILFSVAPHLWPGTVAVGLPEQLYSIRGTINRRIRLIQRYIYSVEQCAVAWATLCVGSPPLLLANAGTVKRVGALCQVSHSVDYRSWQL